MKEHAFYVGREGREVFWNIPLPVADAERATRLHLAGMWLIFVASAALIAWFVARMAAAIRSRDRELAAAREEAGRPTRFVRVPGGDHRSIQHDDELQDLSVRFLLRALA